MTPVIYDTLTRSLQPLMPADGETFRFYCCGPTVYGPAHIGNFRTFIMQDVLRRVIEAAGIRTKHVRNITDVDDKTIRQSQAEGKSLGEFTAYWTRQFHADCEALNLLRPHVEPGAVDHIAIQVRMIEKLMEKGHAYVGEDGSVYYRVSSFESYGRLSRLQEREITTTSAAAQSDDEYDRESAADFALWKAHKPEDGPNAWDSPWGKGRPGWHLECSAMSVEYLGETFDLHSGGVDLLFPHHENEIAQSEACTGKTFARLWFHSTHLMVEGHKMSKSLGNLYTLADVRAHGFEPMALRYVLVAGQYRQPLNFTWDSLHAAQSALRRLQQLDAALADAAGTPADAVIDRDAWDVFAPVFEAMAQNLNTPDALGKLFTAVHAIERDVHGGVLTAERAHEIRCAFLRTMDLFGFKLEPLPEAVAAPKEVQELAARRWQAKKDRDFAAADALRQQVEALGWRIRDAKDGYELAPA
jgi:cysteinyl-tRNA synthetase